MPAVYRLKPRASRLVARAADCDAGFLPIGRYFSSLSILSVRGAVAITGTSLALACHLKPSRRDVAVALPRHTGRQGLRAAYDCGRGGRQSGAACIFRCGAICRRPSAPERRHERADIRRRLRLLHACRLLNIGRCIVRCWHFSAGRRRVATACHAIFLISAVVAYFDRATTAQPAQEAWLSRLDMFSMSRAMLPR